MRFARVSVLAAALMAIMAISGFAQAVQYIVPEELPSLPYSYGVAFPVEVKTKEVLVTAAGTKFGQTGITATAPAAKDLSGQMSQALTNLDVALKELRTTRNDIAKMHIEFVGNTFDQVEMLSDHLENYFLLRNASKEVKFPPVRTLIGKDSLGDPAKLVDMKVTLIDPKTKPEVIQSQGIEVAEDFGTHGKSVLLGGITAMNKAYMVKGLNSMRTQMQTSLKNLDLVLSKAGGSREDVKVLNVFYTPKPQTDAPDPKQAEQLLNEELKKFFGETNAPTVTLQADAVNCSAFLSVLLDAQAITKGTAPKDQPKQPGTKSLL
jgi:enamine deaminase RidA (YjgF/YER057c/UK114 family)